MTKKDKKITPRERGVIRNTGITSYVDGMIRRRCFVGDLL